jgi:glycine betaine catabolism B
LRKTFQKLLDYLDGFLDGLTSYSLVLYFLIIVSGWGVVLGFAGNLAYTGPAIALSALALVAACWAVNAAVSRFLNIYANRESYLITALILALILPPASNVHGYVVLLGAAVAAIVSKYVITWGRRHIFNPAAVGAYFIGVVMNTYPSWWVGTKPLAPLVFVGGILIMRKMQRFSMVAVFMAIYLAALAITLQGGSSSMAHVLWLGIIGTPVMFFAYVMFTEPLTSPSSRNKCLIYAVAVGLLYSVNKLHISPEEALLIGNALAFAMAPTRRLSLDFLEKRKEADGIYSFVFKATQKLAFAPGQYLEWTLPERGGDSRGNRRYLTVASSPTEDKYIFTVKIPPTKPSSFKKRLLTFSHGDKILASHPSGSFTLPSNPGQKLAFIAGGIGVTPFRSIAQYLIDTDQKRDVALFYSATTPGEFAFSNVFAKAGFKVLFSITPPKDMPVQWSGRRGTIDADLVKSVLPDWQQRIFYLSGPYGFVKVVRQNLLTLGVKPSAIKADYFPGYG